MCDVPPFRSSNFREVHQADLYLSPIIGVILSEPHLMLLLDECTFVLIQMIHK